MSDVQAALADLASRDCPALEQEHEQHIQQSLARGWFQGNAEFTPDLAGVALPLRLPDQQLAVLVADPRPHHAHRRVRAWRTAQTDRLAGGEEGCYSRSLIVALAMPPPSHMVHKP